MASTTKLSVWNGALREIAGAPLADTTTVNAVQRILNDAWDHAVEYVLATYDWGFSRRRATLSTASDTGFPPYTYRATKPSDYLRKCWIKTNAYDEYQVDHAEIAASFYMNETTALIEYVSDHSDNYNPANWPPHFTRVLTLHLAAQIAPKVARAGSDDLGRLNGQLGEAIARAKEQEAVFLTNESILVARQPVMRRALEFMGQVSSGSVGLHAQADQLRWQMNRAWEHCLKHLLEQAAWNFATRRAIMTDGTAIVPGSTLTEVTEGYVVSPATDTTSSDVSASEFEYGFTLPDDFVHKIWIKGDANHDYECPHQFIGRNVFANLEPVVMEYVAYDDDSKDPTYWSASFTEALAAYLALTVTPELLLVEGTKSTKVVANDIRRALEVNFARKLSDAKLRDAIQQFPKSPPPGRFVRARTGGIGTTSIRRYN